MARPRTSAAVSFFCDDGFQAVGLNIESGFGISRAGR